MKKNLNSFGTPLGRNTLQQLTGGGVTAAAASCAGPMCGGFAGATCEGTCRCAWVQFADYGYCVDKRG
ncbi:hypothetical protein KTO58_23440 [Chitinophaga pendula]|uniref:hypothetical protein n=1 Tax=Chitinophaga TaxID=79328 RepID=UPI000BAF06A4|nr:MULTISPECIES: hypothetical protein [Chitinophaga]ASZ10438.1 hypothetical protein CK934_05325 [Chitinophaga sp. MD30]UCJ06593.1 hypothetical protein KTO58_23440 [Chitinophaga pendula]